MRPITIQGLLGSIVALLGDLGSTGTGYLTIPYLRLRALAKRTKQPALAAHLPEWGLPRGKAHASFHEPPLPQRLHRYMVY